MLPPEAPSSKPHRHPVRSTILVGTRAIARMLLRQENPEDEMTTAAQKKKVHKVMHEHKKGKLKSGSGKKVRSRKQAIAIAMSESGQSKKKAN
jgi:hypothetical protein